MIAQQNNFDFLQFQQKYMQWKQQRTAAVFKNNLGTGKGERPEDSDEFSLLAAKGAATLKQQRSTLSFVVGTADAEPPEIQAISQFYPSPDKV